MPLHLPKTLPAFFWKFLKPYRLRFIGMILAVTIYAILISVSPYLMKMIIDEIAQDSLNTSLISRILWPSIWFIVVYQSMDLIWGLYDYLKLKTLPNVRADIMNAMYAYLQGHSYSFFQKNFSGSLANKINDMARGAESILTQIVDPMFSQCMTLLIATIVMCTVNIWFGIILLFWSFIFLSTVFFFYHKTLQYSHEFSETTSVCVGKLVDAVSNIMSSKLFAQQKYEQEYLGKYIEESKLMDIKLHKHLFLIKILQGFWVTLLFAFMMGFLIYAREENLVTVGDFALILTLSMSVMQGLWYLASHFLSFSQELGVCEQAMSIMKIPHGMKDAKHAKNLIVSQGEITFEGVHFNYERGNNVFQDKSLKILGGQKVGLVGFSGSGKTTFASLILRVFDVNSGRILIDGQDISKVTQSSLHKNIAMIPQDPILFHRSLYENIHYGNLRASQDEVISASKKAHCHDFIELLPDGYDSEVGERGVKLSGGQRQRIAIARAFLKNAPILILDEATSSLDSLTEKNIQESLDELMQNRTVIVIAHRLSTLSHLDRILVFMNGHVVEDGNHEALLARGKHYATLWRLQAGGFLPEHDGEYQENVLDPIALQDNNP
jgi:ATP-binding cassette subfamily B protein